MAASAEPLRDAQPSQWGEAGDPPHRAASGPAGSDRPGLPGRLRDRFDAMGLPWQVGWAGAGCALIAAIVTWTNGGQQWPSTLAIAAAALAASAAGVLLARRTQLALQGVGAAARTLARDDAPDDRQMPFDQSSRELRHTTHQLHRMVEAARRRERALLARNAALSGQLANRTHELTTLQDLSIGLATKSDLHELVEEALGALEQTMDYASASVWSRGDRQAGAPVSLLGYRVGAGIGDDAGEDLVGMRLSRANLQRYEQIEAAAEPIIENQARQSLLSWLWAKVIDDAPSSALYSASRSWMAVPLKARSQVLGVLRVDHHEPDYFDAERARLLLAVSSQTALAMRHAQLLAEQRETAVISERNRIARDLHDAVSQTLFAANVTAGALARSVLREPPPSAESTAQQAQTLERLNRGALAEMRLLLFELRPDALHGVPLSELLQQAIAALVSRGEVSVMPSLANGDDLPPDVRVQLYRIAQEALSNIARHSGASRAEIEWKVDDSSGASLRIADNGRGFDVGQRMSGHFGLENMRSRAEEIGATFELVSTPGQGTELRVDLKRNASNEQ